MPSSTTHEPSFTQLVAQALMNADRPLTVAEIKARVEMIRPVRARDPQATIRGAINNVTLAVSLGGRPSRYTWWPRHLVDNAFRQPLADSDLKAGTLVVNKEVWLALWPDFHAVPSRSQGEVTLLLSPFPLPGGRARDGGAVLQGRIQHLVAGEAVWGLPPTSALADWYCRQGATPDDTLIVRVLDADARRYAMALSRRIERDETAIAARNQALADAAEKVLRAARGSLIDSWLIPRLIARGRGAEEEIGGGLPVCAEKGTGHWRGTLNCSHSPHWHRRFGGSYEQERQTVKAATADVKAQEELS